MKFKDIVYNFNEYDLYATTLNPNNKCPNAIVLVINGDIIFQFNAWNEDCFKLVARSTQKIQDYIMACLDNGYIVYKI